MSFRASKFRKTFTVGAALATTATAGTVYYAKLSPPFREKVEGSVPGAKYMLSTILGPQPNAKLPGSEASTVTLPAWQKYTPGKQKTIEENGLLKVKLERDKKKAVEETPIIDNTPSVAKPEEPKPSSTPDLPKETPILSLSAPPPPVELPIVEVNNNIESGNKDEDNSSKDEKPSSEKSDNSVPIEEKNAETFLDNQLEKLTEGEIKDAQFLADATLTKLSEEELTLMIAYAYRKIVALQEKIARIQASQKGKVDEIVHRELLRESETLKAKVEEALAQKESELRAEFEKEVSTLKTQLGEDFETNLKRQAKAHAVHLQEVLEAQQRELNRHWTGRFENFMVTEQLKTTGKLAEVYGVAKGVEDALKWRHDAIKAANRSRELWTFCQAFWDTLRTSTDRVNWAAVLKSAVEKNKSEDGFVDSILQPLLNQDTTITPLVSLKRRFLDVERVGRRVALIDDNGGSILRYALSYVQSVLVANPLRAVSASDMINVEEITAFEALANARYFLEIGDIEQAIRCVNLLRGEPRRVAQDWLTESRRLLEAQQAAEVLVAYATCVGLENL